MPTEVLLFSKPGKDAVRRQTVLPGANRIVAEDYSSGTCEEIIVEADRYDKGADVFKVNRLVREANKGGITDAMHRQCYIGSVATKGTFGPLEITSAEGESIRLVIEHTTDRFEYDTSGRLRQIEP